MKQFENHIKDIIRETVTSVLNEKDEIVQLNNPTMLDEMARINRNEQHIFPYQKYTIEVRSRDHTPPHFHILFDGYDISFTIEDGKLYRVNSGNKHRDYTKMQNMVNDWLNCQSATRPQTNRENAWTTWHDLHG